MVLQALQPFILIAMLCSVASAEDMEASSSEGMNQCITSTDLDFTEKEACHFDSMTQVLIKINARNLEQISGVSSGVMQTEQEYGQSGKSPDEFMSNLAKAKAKINEKSSDSINRMIDLVLLDSEIRKLIVQLEKINIENQMLQNKSLIKEGMGE